MGADCIISGIRPQIAQTIVHLGVDLGDVITKATLADAFALALKHGHRGTTVEAVARPSERCMDRIPILKMGDFLLVTIQVDMHDQLALALQDDLTDRIVDDRASGVLIDISALEMVDSFIGRMLGNIAAWRACSMRRRSWWACSRPSRSRWSSSACRSPGVRTALNVERGHGASARVDVDLAGRERRVAAVLSADRTSSRRVGAAGDARARAEARASVWSIRPSS